MIHFFFLIRLKFTMEIDKYSCIQINISTLTWKSERKFNCGSMI